MNQKPTLYLIRGVPGAGKSTFADSMWECGLVDKVIEADHYFYRNGEYKFNASELTEAHQLCQMNARLNLLEGKNVAVSNTSVTEWEVGTYELMAIECNAKFVSIILENRHGNSSVHGVPLEKVEQMKKKFSVKL